MEGGDVWQRVEGSVVEEPTGLSTHLALLLRARVGSEPDNAIGDTYVDLFKVFQICLCRIIVKRNCRSIDQIIGTINNGGFLQGSIKHNYEQNIECSGHGHGGVSCVCSECKDRDADRQRQRFVRLLY